MAKHRILRASGARIAWTNTSKVPDEHVKVALRVLAKELPGALDGYLVHVKNTRNWDRGWHYHGVATIGVLPKGRWRGTITVLTPGPRFTGLEWLNTLAHEAKHAEQRTSGTHRRQKRERNCEKNACAFASWFVDHYREMIA